MSEYDDETMTCANCGIEIPKEVWSAKQCCRCGKPYPYSNTLLDNSNPVDFRDEEWEENVKKLASHWV